MILRVPRCVDSPAALDALLLRIKLLPCKHCGAQDTLIGHGLLRGYHESSSHLVVRGRRFFCSNRGKRTGCGRTLSVLLSQFVERCTVMTTALFGLLCGLGEGRSVQRAANEVTFPLCLRSAYRLALRLKRSGLWWRGWLIAQSVPPVAHSSSPLAQLAAHLAAALGDEPLSGLQLKTQRSALS